MAEDDKIDQLLARYLNLLDTYTTLRSELSELQSSLYHSIARANFSAERGLRYGQDFYDERMQATKVLATDYFEDRLPKFELVNLNATLPIKTKEMETDNKTNAIAEKLEQTTLSSYETEDRADISENHGETEAMQNSEPKTAKQPKSQDPLRWFGILSPLSLRQAQSSALKLVETGVKLSSVDAEMRAVEIEIRRARKRKTKGEKVLEKDVRAEPVKAIGGGQMWKDRNMSSNT